MLVDVPSAEIPDRRVIFSPSGFVRPVLCIIRHVAYLHSPVPVLDTRRCQSVAHSFRQHRTAVSLAPLERHHREVVEPAPERHAESAGEEFGGLRVPELEGVDANTTSVATNFLRSD